MSGPPVGLGYGDLCGREWRDEHLPALGWQSHRCRRLDGHSSEHVCGCGARLDERLDLEEVPD